MQIQIMNLAGYVSIFCADDEIFFDMTIQFIYLGRCIFKFGDVTII